MIANIEGSLPIAALTSHLRVELRGELRPLSLPHDMAVVCAPRHEIHVTAPQGASCLHMSQRVAICSFPEWQRR
jgi:hypothetical protein